MPQIWPSRPPTAGTANISNSTQTVVDFPAPYASPPIVVATTVQSRIVVTVQDITTTGFRAIVDGTIPRLVNWVAVPAT